MYRTLIGILSAFGVAILAVALTFSHTLEAPADLRFANGTEPKTLDPALMSGEPEAIVAGALFEGLARYDPRTLKPVPGIAASWDISPDGTVYTFHLRPDARWSDGHPVTASDFVYAWKRVLDPKLGSEVAYMLFSVDLAEAYDTYGGHVTALTSDILPALAELRARAPLDARDFQTFLRLHKVNDPLRPIDDHSLTGLASRRTGTVTAVELDAFRAGLERARAWLDARHAEAVAHFGVDRGIIARDPHTLVVELRGPTPYFLQILAHHSSYPVPRWAVEAHGDSWFLPGSMVSDGPFELESWIVNDHIRVVKNPMYWGRDAVRLHSIDLSSMENTTTNVNQYLTGALDIVPHNYFPQELAPALRKRPDFSSAPALVVYFYRLNVTRKPFDDPRVRRAVNLAIDRELITSSVLGLGQLPAYTFVPPGLAGYTPPANPLRHDVAEARRLLAEAGYPGGRGFPHVGLLYNTNEDHKRLAEVVADQLRRNLGIEITAYNQEWQSYLDTVRALDYDVSRAGWIADYTDPNTFLDMWVTNGANNSTGFSSELYDRLIRMAGNVSLFLDDPEPVLARLRNPAALRPLLPAATHGAGAEEREARTRVRSLLLCEAESILLDEAPIIPIYFYVNGNLVSPRVHGYTTKKLLDDGSYGPNVEDIHPFRDLWVEPRTEGP